MRTNQAATTTGRAIGYVRVSSDKQATGGVSLEAQTARIQAMATVQDAALLEVIVDAGESAKTLNRPGKARASRGRRSAGAGPEEPGGQVAGPPAG